MCVGREICFGVISVKFEMILFVQNHNNKLNDYRFPKTNYYLHLQIVAKINVCLNFT